MISLLSLTSGTELKLAAGNQPQTSSLDVSPVTLGLRLTASIYGPLDNHPDILPRTITAVATNNMETNLTSVTLIFEIRDSKGISRYISWRSSAIPAHETVEASVSWTPPHPDTYEFRVFAISDFENPQFLSVMDESSKRILHSREIAAESELLNQIKDLDEVRAILNIYDNPFVGINKTKGLDVEYHISTSQFEEETYDPTKDCLFVKFHVFFNGTIDLVFDSTGSNEYESGDPRLLEFLNDGGGCLFSQVKAIPQATLISRTMDFEEVRAFLAKYPSAELWLDRQGAIVIGYSITRAEVTGERWNKPGVPEPLAGIQLQLDRHLNLQSIELRCIYDTGSDDAIGFYVSENIVDYLNQEEHCWEDERFAREGEPAPDGMTAVTFDDDPWLTKQVGCVYNITSAMHTCEDPAHSEWLRAQGILISGDPDGMAYTTRIVGTWHTRIVLGYHSDVDNNGGLGQNETLTVHFVNGPTDFASMRLTSNPSDDDFYNNVPFTAVLTTHGETGSILSNHTRSFTSVTNRTYTPADFSVSTNDTHGQKIYSITLQIIKHPHDGIYVERITFTQQSLVERDLPPVISVPREKPPMGPGGEVFDEPGAPVFFEVYAYDDNDGPLKTLCEPPSGSFFPVGTSIIICTAQDSYGNQVNATFPLTVIDRALEITDRLANFTAIDGTVVGSWVRYPMESNVGGIAVNPVTNRIYVADTNNSTLAVIDGNEEKIVAKIPLFWNPIPIGINQVTNTIFVPTGTLYVIDGQDNKVIAKVQDVGNWVSDIAVNDRTNKVYLVAPDENKVYVVDGLSNKVSDSFSTGAPYGVTIDSETNIVYVTNRNWNPGAQNTNTLSLINGTDNTLINNIDVGADPFDVAVNPRTKMIYTTNFGNNSVSVIDGTTLEVVASVPVGPEPQGVVVDPSTNRIYVAADFVYVIDGRTNNVIGLIRAEADKLDIDFLRNTLFLTHWSTPAASSVPLQAEELESLP